MFSRPAVFFALVAGFGCVAAAQDSLDDMYLALFKPTENKNTLKNSTVAPALAEPPPERKNTCTGECVHYYLCSNSTIAYEVGQIDIRIGEDPAEESECPHFLDTCCKEEDVLDKPALSILTTVAPPLSSTGKRQTCGNRNIDGLGFRITGNKQGESEYGEFPWMLAVLREKRVGDIIQNGYECGASLLAPSVVLTVAHRVYNKPKRQLLIRGGEWDTQTDAELYAHQDRRVAEIITHEAFNRTSLANDIALLVLTEPFELAANLQPICLPPEGQSFDHSKCFSSGWGKDVFGKEGKYQVILKKVELPVMPNKQCQDALRTTRLGRQFLLHPSLMCAGGIAGQDTCRGDGGSPLVCPIPGTVNQYYQAGIVAGGIGCGENGIPGVYTNVQFFREWIDQVLVDRSILAREYVYTP